MIIAYDGSNFHGWQTQKDRRTVQEQLEKHLSLILREPVSVNYAARTDAGVHAEFQTVDFDTNSDNDLYALQKSLNSLFRGEVAARRIEEVSADFHSRFSATSRLYRYRIYNAPAMSPFHRKYALHVTGKLDAETMASCLKYLIGEHDFSSFRSSSCSSRTPMRHMIESWQHFHPPFIDLYFRANAFLHNMIRILAGTLLDIGRGKITEKRFVEILNARDRTVAGKTAAPHALCLMEITYPDMPGTAMPGIIPPRKHR